MFFYPSHREKRGVQKGEGWYEFVFRVHSVVSTVLSSFFFADLAARLPSFRISSGVCRGSGEGRGVGASIGR